MDIKDIWNTERAAINELHAVIKTTPTNWGSDLDLTLWQGVTTNETGLVTGLYLNALGIRTQLADIITPLLKLKFLEVLNLGDNNITGEIPVAINKLEVYCLYLGDNKLEGFLPSLDMPHLERLDLSRNKLTGVLPAIAAPRLERLTLNNNYFTGHIPAVITPLDRNHKRGADWVELRDYYMLNVQQNNFTSMDAALAGMSPYCFSFNPRLKTA